MSSLKEELKLKVPTTLVIFGVTGDLSRKKLLPAIFDLYTKGLLPDRFRLVGFSRRNLSIEEFTDLVKSSLNGKATPALVGEFMTKAHYVSGSFDDLDDYLKLSQSLNQYDDDWGICSNKLLYLAVPPSLYENIFSLLKKSGLSKSCVEAGRFSIDDDMESLSGWTRILVEKPFGRDVKTAGQLEKQLSGIFTEDQIFRIDHYLAKETIQNILSWRFANSLFENIWHGKNIARMDLRLYESGLVSERGSFYDSVGALRDVGQNHLMQMLAIVTMDKPDDLSCFSIRRERAKVLQKIKIPNWKYITNNVKRGQYEGFLKEAGVAEKSTTETYFKLKLKINGSRWKETDFYLESGKGMGVDKTEIVVHLRQDDEPLFLGTSHINRIVFNIQPDEGISVRFWAKQPGFGYDLTPKDLSFTYESSLEHRAIPDAYERLLHDALAGDQTLFTTTEEVQASWKFITAILDNFKSVPLEIYPPGRVPDISLNDQ